MNIVDYLNNIDKEELNKFLTTTSSDITIKRKTEAKTSDTSWIDMVEECIPYLDNIIRNPRRFIVQEENIVPIEKTKVVTEESIRHLAQNTNLIQEVHKDGTVIPLKLLNVYREETVDLYENRFIKSLVDNLYVFVNNKLNESDQRSYAIVNDNVTYKGVVKTKNTNINVTLNLDSSSENEVDASKDGHSLEERISHIRDILASFRSSTFIKGLKESSPVRSPIRKTNVILKEPNFIKALELWEYLEKNNIKPMTEITKREDIIKDEKIKELYDLAFFIEKDSLQQENKNEISFDAGIVSKLVNDFVFAGNITEAEFKKLVEKEFREASKRKEKVINNVKKTINLFLNDYEKRKKKAYTILK